MSAQRSTQQAGSREQERGQQTGLARRSDLPSVPSLLLDPLGFFSDDPFTLVRRMQREMNRLFTQAGVDVTGRGGNVPSAAWTPTTEIALQDGNLVVSTELPGVREEDIHVEIDGDFLVIRGERKVEQEQQEGGIRRTERQYGEFYRAIALPDGADIEHARAEFQNGVLRVVIPVAEAQSNVRQIPVQATTSTQGEQKPEGTQTPAEQKAA